MEATQTKQPDSFATSRFGLFTASEIYKLLVSPKAKDSGMFGDTAITYIEEKIAECITGEGKPPVKSIALDWGLENEQDAIMWFTQITGKQVQHFGVNEYKFFPYKNSGGCSPDGKVIGESACVQVKCPFLSSNHVSYLRVDGSQEGRQTWLKKNAKEYYAQCQFEMMCLGEAEGKKTLDKCYFVTYDPRTNDHWLRMSVFELTPDEALQNDIDIRVTTAHEIVAKTLKTFSEPTENYYGYNSPATAA